MWCVPLPHRSERLGPSQPVVDTTIDCAVPGRVKFKHRRPGCKHKAVEFYPEISQIVGKAEIVDMPLKVSHAAPLCHGHIWLAHHVVAVRHAHVRHQSR